MPSSRVSLAFALVTLVLVTGMALDFFGWGPMPWLGMTVIAWVLIGLVADPALGRIAPFPVLACCGGFVIGFDLLELTVWVPNTVLWQIDTVAYWRWLMPRTAGYPLLLHLFARLPGTLLDLVVIQFLAAGASALFLAHVVRRSFRSTTLGVATAVLLTVKHGLIVQHLTMMTDSLFGSCVTASLAILLLLWEQPTWRRVSVLGGVIAAASLLRPATLGLLLPFAILAALTLRRRRIKFGCGIAAALGLGLFANSAVHPFVALALGNPNAVIGNMAPFSLMGTAGFLLSGETPTTNPVLRDRLVAEFAPYREAWLNADGLENQGAVLLSDADIILYRHAIRATCEVVAADCEEPRQPAVAAAMARISVEAIIHDPAGMARIVYVRLWNDMLSSYGALSGAWAILQASPFEEMTRLERENRFTMQAFNPLGYRTEPTAVLIAPPALRLPFWFGDNRRPLNLLLLGCCGASFGWLALARRTGRDQTPAGVLATAAIGLLWYHFVVSIGQFPFDRYAEPMTGWIVFIIGGNIVLLTRNLAYAAGFNRSRVV